MKIYVSNIPNTHNYGSAMMAINALYYLRQEMPDAEFYSDCKDTAHLSNIVVSAAIDRIYKSPIVRDYWNTSAFVKEIVKNYDSVLILGGDDFSEYYTRFYLLFDLDIVKELSEHMPVVMLGQTIGPFTPFIKNTVRNSLKNVNIYTRDPDCLNYCKQELGLANVHENQDLSLLDLPDQNDRDYDLLNLYGLESEKYVTLVPSGFVAWYCDNREAYIRTWIEIIKETLKSPYLNERIIFLLPHDIRQPDSDTNCILEIMERLDEGAKHFVRYTDKELSPAQARCILGNGCYTVTGRMHAGLSTLQTGKPAVFLSYSVKYKGVVGTGLGLQELIVEAVGTDLWENGEIFKQVMDKILMVQENYGYYKECIERKIAEAKKIVRGQIDSVYDYLRQGRAD